MGENDWVAARILHDFDADAEKIRNEIIRMLSGPARREQAPPSKRETEAAAANPELAAELERVLREKEEALDERAFERAARLRDQERRLRQQLFGWPVAWQSESQEIVTKMPRTSVSFPSKWKPGWLLCGVALVIGIWIGWVIWGEGAGP